HRVELTGYRLDKALMIEIARGGKYHVAGVEAVAVVVEKLPLREAADRLRRPQDRLAQRMAFPEALREQLVHQHVGIVFVDLDLFQNHTAFTLDIRGGEGGVKHQVSENVERHRNVVGERLHIEANRLLPGEGVEVAADRIHLPRD